LGSSANFIVCVHPRFHSIVAAPSTRLGDRLKKGSFSPQRRQQLECFHLITRSPLSHLGQPYFFAMGDTFVKQKYELARANTWNLGSLWNQKTEILRRGLL
jgi:hypothetical protein